MYQWTDAVDATRTSKFQIETVNSAAATVKLEVLGSGQLVLNEYTTGTSFQGSSGSSVGVLNVDGTGNVFVGAGGGSGIDGANSRRWAGLNTSVVPSSGNARLRDALGATTNNPSAVIDIRISRYDETNADMQAWFTALNSYRTANPSKAYIQITNSSDNSVFGIYQIGSMAFTSSPIEYWTIGLTYISGSVGLFSSGNTITFSWVLFGADGTGGTGTVTSITAGTGLDATASNPILISGTISLNSKLAPADNLTGNAGKLLAVNSTETAVEYVTAPTGTGDSVSPFLLMGG
jgi:hypothetical protein